MKLLVPTLSLFLSCMAVAGISTNGAERSVDQDNVWYLGPDTIEYCVQVAPSYSIKPAVASKLVGQAINGWVTFFKRYGIDQKSFDTTSGLLKMSLSFKEVANCSKPDQLKFSFDYDNDDVIEAASQRARTESIAIRHDYDHVRFRNGGTVWIRNGSFSELEIKHLLLHELGHVFGMEHDSVHVMSSKTAHRMLIRSLPASTLGMIESPTWRYRLEAQDQIAFTFNGALKKKYDPNFLLPFVRDVIGFKQGGNHSLDLKMKRIDPNWSSSWSFDLIFTELETGKSVTLHGLFAARQTQAVVHEGPILYTDFNCSQCTGGTVRTRKYLDSRPVPDEFDGSFEWNGTLYPALLEKRKGFVLRLFVPQRKAWWATDRHSGSYFID